MRIFITLLLFFSTAALAEVSREEAESMIDEMVKSNMISKEEAQKAKFRLYTMNANEWSRLNEESREISRGPASVSVAPEDSDLDEEQFAAIENDLKMIAPHTLKPNT